MSQKRELFITTAGTTSNPTTKDLVSSCERFSFMSDEYVTMEHVSLGNTRLFSLRFSIPSVT
jgi:hypothetical protein